MKKVEMVTNTDNQEYVDFSQNLCSWVIPKLEQLREATENCGTHPLSIHDYDYSQFCFDFIFDEEITLRSENVMNLKWLGILDDIIWAFKAILNKYEGKFPAIPILDEEKRIEAGLNLFSKHLDDLWL